MAKEPAIVREAAGEKETEVPRSDQFAFRTPPTPSEPCSRTQATLPSEHCTTYDLAWLCRVVSVFDWVSHCSLPIANLSVSWHCQRFGDYSCWIRVFRVLVQT